MPSKQVNSSIASRRKDKASGKKAGARKKKDAGEEEYTGERKAKAERNPNTPKKPMTSYFIYMNENRSDVKAADPSLTFTTLTRKLTENWRALGKEEKKVYEDMAVRDKERYHSELRA